MKPLVSVLIPHYNYLHYVPTAIDSALAQTYPNVEVVVTDNCSTDGAVPVLRERYRDEPRVRIVENERNLGMTGNFNRALEHARGEYILWLSADDFLLPAHLQRLQAVFEAHPQIDCVYSGAYFADAEGRAYTTRVLGAEFPVDYVDARDELLVELSTTCPLCLPAALFPRALIEELGPMDDDEYMAADWEYAIRVAAAGKRFAYLAEPSVCVRIHGPQRSGTEYHRSGRNVLDYVGYLAKYIDHPCMERVRGRELAIVAQLDLLVNAARDFNDGASPFSAGVEDRFSALRSKLVSRAAAYEPARVRESRVSVIIAASGPPQVAVEAIESVATQTFPNVEIVVVDHGPVPLGNILRAHPAWNRISHLHLPTPRTTAAANNLGLRMARGEYLAVLNPDNRYAPTHLASLVDLIERVGTEVAVASSVLAIERPDPLFTSSEIVGEAQIFREVQDPVELGYIAPGLPLDAILFYRRNVDRVGRFNETLGALEDFEYLLRLEHVQRFAWTRQQTVEIRVRLGLAAQSYPRILRNFLPMLDAIYQGYAVAPPVAAARARFRQLAALALESKDELIRDPQGLAELFGSLTGKKLLPALATT